MSIILPTLENSLYALPLLIEGAQVSAKIAKVLVNTAFAHGAQLLNPTQESTIEDYELTVITPNKSTLSKNLTEQFEDLIKQTEDLDMDDEQFSVNIEIIEELTNSLMNVHTKSILQETEQQRTKTLQKRTKEKDLEFLRQHTTKEVLQFISSSKSEAQKEAGTLAKQEIQDMQGLEEILVTPVPSEEEMMNELEEILNTPISEFSDEELMAEL